MRDLVPGGVVERLRELLFLRADHVPDVPADGHLVVLLAATGIDLDQAAVGQRPSLLVTMTSVSVCLAGGERDHVAAFDEPDVGFIGPAD